MPDNFTVERVTWATHAVELAAVRRRVFIEEQGVAEEVELDDRDAGAMHFLGLVDGLPVATARMLGDGHVGRVAVLKECRGRGYGAVIMRFAETHARALGWQEIALSSQVHALPFYRQLGYEVVGEEFMEAGIPHRDMVLRLAAPDNA